MVQKKLIDSLLAIEQTGSFTKAAEILYTTQSSLSRSVHTLENELGVQLFNRQSFPIRPTYYGKLYLKSCREVLMINNSTESLIRETLAGKQGQITFGLSRFLSRCFFHKIITEFSRDFPNVQIVLMEGSSPILEDKLLEGAIDVALVAGKRNEPRLEYIPIVNETIVLTIPPSFAKEFNLSPGFNELPCSFETLEKYPFILLRRGHGLRNCADSFFEETGIHPYIAFETEDIDVAVSLSNADMGLSFTSEFSTKIDKTTNPIYYCSLGPAQRLRPISICRNKGLYHLKAEDELIQIIYRVVQNVFNDEA